MIILRSIIILYILSINSLSFANTYPSAISSLNESEESKYCNHENYLVHLIEKITPSVINIYTEHHQRQSQNNILPQIPLNIQAFINRLNLGKFSNAIKSDNIYSLGSGFIISEDGLAITNYHVIANAKDVKIKTYDEKEYNIIIIATDEKKDIALIKIDSDCSFRSVVFGDINKLKIGNSVIAVSNPLGFGNSVTKGIISYMKRKIGDENSDIADFLQTDSIVTVGSSGSPLFNMRGEVIGMNSMMPNLNMNHSIGIGFAIPIDTIQKSLDSFFITKNDVLEKTELGISVQNITNELLESLEINQKNGVLVTNIKNNSIAAKSNFLIGDIIIEFDEFAVQDTDHLHTILDKYNFDKEIRATVVRNGEVLSLLIKKN